MPTKKYETCKWYISLDEPECGEVAVAKITIRSKIGQATVPVCTEHKAYHDRSFAKIRATERGNN